MVNVTKDENKKLGLGSLSLPLFLVAFSLSYLSINKKAAGEHLLEYLNLNIPVSIITVFLLIIAFFLGNRYNTNLFAKSGKLASKILLYLFIIVIIVGIVKTIINIF